MGATLPILARYFVSRPFELGRVSLRLGTLYAVNLFGAVAGSFLAGFIFLPMVGVRSTNLVAASFDISLAVAILVARRIAPKKSASAVGETLDELAAAAPQSATAGPAIARTSPTARRAVLFAFAVSGATAMTLQVLWTRALAVIIGSSIFSFTIILLAFLIGLGSGSAVFGRFVGRRNPVRGLALTHLGIVACIGLSYIITDRLPFVFTYLLSSTLVSADAVLTCQFALACLTVLPSTFLMGAIFPLTVRVVTGDLTTVGPTSAPLTPSTPWAPLSDLSFPVSSFCRGSDCSAEFIWPRLSISRWPFCSSPWRPPCPARAEFSAWRPRWPWPAPRWRFRAGT